MCFQAECLMTECALKHVVSDGVLVDLILVYQILRGDGATDIRTMADLAESRQVYASSSPYLHLLHKVCQVHKVTQHFVVCHCNHQDISNTSSQVGTSSLPHPLALHKTLRSTGCDFFVSRKHTTTRQVGAFSPSCFHELHEACKVHQVNPCSRGNHSILTIKCYVATAHRHASQGLHHVPGDSLCLTKSRRSRRIDSPSPPHTDVLHRVYGIHQVTHSPIDSYAPVPNAMVKSSLNCTSSKCNGAESSERA